MNFITRAVLPRRRFLRGLGTTLALPMLDAMVPALSAKPLSSTPRLGFVYISNGVIQEQWHPKIAGRDFDLPPILKPLGAMKDQVNILTNLSHLQADTFGDGTGDHPRASAAWLTGVHAYDRTQPGVEVRLATSADQIAANEIGKGTQLSSLELTVDFATQGSCDSGDCFYVNTVSWRNPTTPNQTEMRPRAVFERLFGDGGSSAQRLAVAQDTSSILDSVLQETKKLSGTLGVEDKSKLNEYLDSVREVEMRIQNVETRGKQSVDLPERPVDIPERFEDYVKMMFDLQTLAFRADITRVFSMILARELSSRTFPQIGVPDQHHAVSHHRNDPDLISKKARIDTHHVELFTYLLQKMHDTPDGEGSLLDSSLILLGGGMGNGNLHRHNNLPCLLAGKLGGHIPTGRHLVYPQDTPMTNLLLAVLDKAGVRIDKLGDSTGVINPNPLSLG